MSHPMESFIIDQMQRFQEAANSDGERGLAAAFGVMARGISFKLNQRERHDQGGDLQAYHLEKMCSDLLHNENPKLKELALSYVPGIYRNATADLEGHLNSQNLNG
jgi:hypothetical protein